MGDAQRTLAATSHNRDAVADRTRFKAAGDLMRRGILN
jgi:hypothetical protein